MIIIRKYIYRFFLAVVMGMAAAACGSRTADESVSSPELAADSLIGLGRKQLSSEPSPYHRFDNAGEALEFMRESGHWKQYERGILPQMAVDELEYAEKLLNNKHDGFVVVDKSRMKVIKFNRYGEEVESFGMACAKNYGTKHKRRDARTPEGFFSVKKVHNSTDWHYIDDDGVRSEKTGEFGPRFIRLNIPVTSQIGIHGTCAPWSIGGRRSHGCIRIKNENVMKLVEMVDSGMPVIITPGRKDMEVNLEEGHEIPSISTVPGKPHLSVSDIRSKETLADSRVAVSQEKAGAVVMEDSVINNKSVAVDSIVNVEDTKSGSENTDSTVTSTDRYFF